MNPPNPSDTEAVELKLEVSRGFNHLFIGPMHDPELCPECIRPHSLDNATLLPLNQL